MILALIENEGVLPGELLVPSDSAFFEEAL